MSLARKHLLALDLATITGWCCELNGVQAVGHWNLTPTRDESKDMRIIRFIAKLREILDATEIKLIAFERPAGRHAGAIIVQSELQGIMKSECLARGIAFNGYSSKEIKKFATGKGNAGKPAMIAAAKARWDYTGNDDNEADALAIWHLACEDLNI